MPAPMSRPRLCATREVSRQLVSTMKKRVASTGCPVMKYTMQTYTTENANCKGTSNTHNSSV